MSSMHKALTAVSQPVRPIVNKIRARVRAHLEAERTRLCEEAAVYPTPIPRCDQQFNHLIEQRERISRELDRIDSIADNAAELEAFIGSSTFIDDGMKQTLRAELKPGN